jgi:ubiquitin-protein ligase E3 C
LLVPLITHPFRSFTQDHPVYTSAFQDLLLLILSVSLLPNRIPLASLTHLSSNLPIPAIAVLHDSIPSIASSLSIEDRIHTVSNLLAFAPPRYSKLSVSSITTLLTLFTSLINALPVQALDPPERNNIAQPSAYDSDDESPILVTVASSSTPAPQPLVPLDPRTRKRLQTIVAGAHIKSLLSVTQNHPSARSALYDFLLALCTVWPTRSDSVLTSIIVTGPGIFRELYRGYVRSSPLGKDDNPAAAFDPALALHWVPLIVLSDLYRQALLTMSDDEFFASSHLTAKDDASSTRNPLTLDEVIALSRKLLTITFALYWRDDQSSLLHGSVVPGMNLRWEAVREKLTKVLLAIHARE